MNSTNDLKIRCQRKLRRLAINKNAVYDCSILFMSAKQCEALAQKHLRSQLQNAKRKNESPEKREIRLHNTLRSNGFVVTRESKYVYKLKDSLPSDRQPTKSDWLRCETEAATNNTVVATYVWNETNNEWRKVYDKDSALFLHINTPLALTDVWIYGKLNSNSINDVSILYENGQVTAYTLAGLQSISLGNSSFREIVINAEYFAFSYNQQKLSNNYILKAVVTDDVKTLPRYCFQNCKSLHVVILGNSLQNTPLTCFEDCISLCEINMSDSVMSLGHKWFEKRFFVK